MLQEEVRTTEALAGQFSVRVDLSSIERERVARPMAVLWRWAFSIFLSKSALLVRQFCQTLHPRDLSSWTFPAYPPNV